MTRPPLADFELVLGSQNAAGARCDRARAFAEQYPGQRCPGIRTQDGARRAFRAAGLVARKIWRAPWWLLYRGSELVGSAELSDVLTVYGVELDGVRQDMLTVTRPAHVWAAAQRATSTEGLEPDLAVDALARRLRSCEHGTAGCTIDCGHYPFECSPNSRDSADL